MVLRGRRRFYGVLDRFHAGLLRSGVGGGGRCRVWGSGFWLAGFVELSSEAVNPELRVRMAARSSSC